MAYEVIITPEAEQQIINMHKYITENAGSVIADNYANTLLDYLEGFSTFPHRGNKRDDIRQGMRVTHFRHRTIFHTSRSKPAPEFYRNVFALRLHSACNGVYQM